MLGFWKPYVLFILDPASMGILCRIGIDVVLCKLGFGKTLFLVYGSLVVVII